MANFPLLNAYLANRRDSNPADPSNVRDYERMRAGRAPFSFGGVLTAARNAASLLGGATSPTGLVGLGATATNTRPKGFFGDVFDQIFGGSINSIPGRTPYDDDLRQAVLRKDITLATADRIQSERNARKQASNFAHSMTHVDAGRHGYSRGERDKSAGRGGMGGGLGANTDSGRDKPGPGGKVR